MPQINGPSNKSQKTAYWLGIQQSATGDTSLCMINEEARIEDLPYHLRWMVRRRAVGLMQKNLAKVLDIDPTVLSAYENGRRLPADPAEFDRRHREAVAQLAAQELALRNVPLSVGDQFEQLIEALSRVINVRLRVNRHGLSQDQATYEVEILEGDPPLRRGATPR